MATPWRRTGGWPAPGAQIDATDYPVGTGSIGEDHRGAGMDLLQQHQVWGESAQQMPLPLRRFGAAEGHAS
jgi:hypothetical protein